MKSFFYPTKLRQLCFFKFNVIELEIRVAMFYCIYKLKPEERVDNVNIYV